MKLQKYTYQSVMVLTLTTHTINYDKNAPFNITTFTFYVAYFHIFLLNKLQHQLFCFLNKEYITFIQI